MGEGGGFPYLLHSTILAALVIDMSTSRGVTSSTGLNDTRGRRLVMR